MGLFDNLGTGNTPNPSGSLFGAPASTGATTSAQTGGGLFGTTTSAMPSGSLFGNPGASTTSSSTGPSLSSTSQPASTGGGLFAGLNSTATTSAGGSGLFNSTATSSAPAAGTGGGLFGATSGGATSQPAASGGSLFGSTLGGTGTTSASTGGGLFGSAASKPASQPAASGGLFGSTNTSAAAPAAGTQATATSGLFGSTLNAPPQSQAGSSLLQSQGQKGPNSAHFEHLLERGRKRNAEQSSGSKGQYGDLPSLQLGLGDIARKVRNIGGSSAGLARGGRGDTKAHYLLAASGVNTAITLRDLNTFSAQAGASVTSSGREPYTDTDLDGYVAGLRNQSTLELIQEGLEQSKRDFDAFLEENVQLNWDLQRRRIYEHFGLVRKDESLEDSINGPAAEDDRGAFGRSSRRGRGFGKSSLAASNNKIGSTLGRSVIGTPKAGNGRASVFGADAERAAPSVLQGGAEDRFQRDRQERFAEQVKKLNQARIIGQTHSVLRHFANTENEAGMDSVQPLVQSYEALIEITGESPEPMRLSDPAAIRARAFRDDYRDEGEAPSSQKALDMRKRIINGSRKLLEKQFYNNLTSTVDKNPREANVGGIPGKPDRIKGYVRILVARKELGCDVSRLHNIGDDYIFAIVFFMLRCGLLDEAVKYVNDYKKMLQHIDHNFVRYVASYAGNRQLSPDLQQRITTMYHSELRNAPETSVDPYRLACYKVLGRCELGRRSLEGLQTGWEDYIWLQFALAREQNRAETSAGETFGLEQLRAEVKQIGDRHFAAGQNSSEIGGYGMYFFLQILAGLFETAVDWLYKNDVVAAVHFAIALDYYGLLRISTLAAPGDNLVTYSTRQLPQIQFGFMIGYYTSPFRTAYPLAAADYLTLIALNGDLEGEAGKQQSSLCWEAIHELVLETREFAALLGDVRPDGSIVPGYIQERKELLRLDSDTEFVRNITMAAATLADEAGRTTDAVLLYHLAEQYDSVITAVNRALSEAIAIDLGQEPMRLEPLKPAPDQQQAQANGQPPRPKTETLSLTSIDNPLDLTQTIQTMYKSDAHKYRAVKVINMQACDSLISIAYAKLDVERGQWKDALSRIQSLALLPIDLAAGASAPIASRALTSPTSPPPNSNITLIRQRAATLQTLPQPVAHTIPALLLMTLTAMSRLRAEVQRGGFETESRAAQVRALGDGARDLMVYAGLVKYKLPHRVFEKLGEVVAESGAL